MQRGCGCICPFFVHSLPQLEVVTVCTLCIVFVRHFLKVILKQWNGHGVEKKEVKIIQEVENNQNLSWNETDKCHVLPLSSLSNIFMWKASILKKESWCEAQPVPTFLKDTATFETLWHYDFLWLKMRPCNNWQQEWELSFCWTYQTKQTTLLDYFK